MEKIINVFFDQSGLPYKERELVTHFPIYGKGGFLGASNTTKIRFYFENIGTLNDTYLAVSKLPNGKQGSQLLNIKSSDENGQYAELSLSEWYFQAKGDVFIGLKVYRGGVDVTIDEETGFSIVSGDPVIMVTGSIMLAINYAPIGDVPDYRDEFTAYNAILALMGDKPDIDTVPLLVDFNDYATWETLYNYVGTRPFVAYVNGVLSVCAIESEDSDYKLLVNNSTGIFRTSAFALDSAIGNEYGGIDFEQYEEKNDNVIDLTGTSGTLTNEQQELIVKPNAYIRKDFNSLYHKMNDDTFLQISLVEYTDYVKLFTSTIVIDSSSSPYTWIETNKTTNIYKKEKVDSLVSGLETKINASGHSLSATIDNQTYVLTIALKDKNNNVISTQQVDLPLESIVTSATYYDEYSYGGVDYEKVIVIVLATTPVPTIVPVGALVEGLITEETLDTTLKDYVKDVEITSVKTVAEVLEEIGGLNHIFSFDLIDIKYFGLFVEGQGTNIDLELWSPSGTSKVTSIDTTQLFRTEMNNAVVEKSYFPSISLSQIIETLSNEQMAILGQDNSFIVYNDRVYVKSNDTDTAIEFACSDIDDTSSNGYHIRTKHRIFVNKSIKTAFVLGSTIYYYDRSQTNDLLLGKQNLLVSGQNIKTINGQSILGSGNIDISGSGATWGSITGNISYQADLQDELKDIRETAEGKTKSYILSYNDTIASVKQDLQNYGYFYVYNRTTQEWEEKRAELINGDYDNLVVSNADFNSQNNIISNFQGCLIFRDIPQIENQAGVEGSKTYYMLEYPNSSYELFKNGDIFYVIEIDVPDRWVGKIVAPLTLYKLETSKVDLTNYATKTEVNAKSDLTNVAPTYDNTLTYTIGEVVSYNGKIYRCTTAITTPEDFDSTHWTETSVASDYVNLTGTQTITGQKTFANGISLGNSQHKITAPSTYATAFFDSTGYEFAVISRTRGFKLNLLKLSDYNSDYGFTFPNTSGFTADKEIATTDQIGFTEIEIPSSTTLTDTQITMFMKGCKIIGSFTIGSITVKNPVFYPCSLRRDRYLGRIVYTDDSDAGYIIETAYTINSSKVISLYNNSLISIGFKSAQGYLNVNGKDLPIYPTTNTSPQYLQIDANGGALSYNDPFTPASVSISDGGTISDTTLKANIQYHRPIVLNGFTCYFSCDDGTNYQYVSTRLDGNTNKIHFNVITINKSTWVATFNTTNLMID